MLLKSTRAALACGAAAVALTGTAARAQSAEGGVVVEEIVVTAEKRETRLLQTPVAVTVVSEEALASANGTGLEPLTSRAPNVFIEANVAASTITIRGVGTNSTGAGGEAAVALHVDGIYQSRQHPLLTATLYDLARTEVLRGPQGTLYGRNSTGGAVNLISAQPAAGFDAAAELEVGSFERLRLTGMLNIPIGDRMAVRLTAVSDERSGYQKNLAPSQADINDQDVAGARLQVRVELSDNVDLIGRVEYAETGGVGAMPKVIGAFRGVPLPPPFGLVPYAAYGASPNPSDPYKVAFNDPMSSDGALWRSSVEYNLRGIDLGGDRTGVFTVLVGYSDLGQDQRSDADQSDATILPFAVQEDYRGGSVEARLSVDGPDWRGLFGVYYLREQTQMDVDTQFFAVPGLPLPFAVSTLQADVDTDSYAVFVQMERELSPDVTVIGGIRYSEDSKEERSVNQTLILDPMTLAMVGAPVLATNQNDWDAVTGKVGLNWKISDDAFAYASISRGFKSGGYSFGQVPFDPEFVWAYEAGLKGRLFDGRMQAAFSTFYYDYTDLQVTFLSTVSGVPTQVTQNAAASKIYGAELEFSARPFANLDIDGAISWLNARFDSTTLADPSGLGAADLSGQPLPRSPDFSARLGGAYRVELGSAGTVTARADVFWSDSYRLRPWGVQPYDIQKSYTRSDASLSWSPPGDAFTLQMYVSNIEDVPVRSFVNYSGVTGNFIGSYSAPRTVGVRLKYAY